MDDIGSIIYIILIIGSAIAGLFQKSKKRSTSQKTTSQEQTWTKGFEEQWDEIKRALQEEVRPQKKVVQKTTTQKPSFEKASDSLKLKSNKEPLSYDTAKDTSKLRLQNHFKKDDKSDNLFESNKDTTENYSIELENIADIRKAIIYNEILNRKYN